MRDMRTGGRGTAREIGRTSRFIAHHEIFGTWFIPNKKTLHRAPTGDWLIQTNTIGIRDSREFPAQKGAGITRALLFGDSFTMGKGVAVEERYSDVMEDQHPRLEILNFGYAGSGTDVQLLSYLHLGRQYESDLLIVAPHVSNITRNVTGYQLRQDADGTLFIIPKPYFTLEGEDLTLHNVPVPNQRIYEDDPAFAEIAQSRRDDQWAGAGTLPLIAENRRNPLHRSALKYRLLRFLPMDPFPQYGSANHPAWKLMKKLLECFAEEADGRTVVIAPLPGWYNVVNPKLTSYLQLFQTLESSNQDLHVIDVLSHFLDLPFRDRVRCFLSVEDGHYSPFGHAVVAEALLTELRERHLIAVPAGA